MGTLVETLPLPLVACFTASKRFALEGKRFCLGDYQFLRYTAVAREAASRDDRAPPADPPGDRAFR